MITKKKIAIVFIIAIIGIVCGRLAVRAFLNMLLGGTMFGGDFL